MDFLCNDAPMVARQLIGWQLFVREPDGSLTGGTILETEAYMADDAASHSYNGMTKRNAVMFGPAGRVYVYFTYGMHWCFNIVTGNEGDGQAVLIRSILPTKNIEVIRQRRGYVADRQLANGPAKLCQALNITGLDNGLVLQKGRIVIQPPTLSFSRHVRKTRRIGIRKNNQVLWRFLAE